MANQRIRPTATDGRLETGGSDTKLLEHGRTFFCQMLVCSTLAYYRGSGAIQKPADRSLATRDRLSQRLAEQMMCVEELRFNSEAPVIPVLLAHHLQLQLLPHRPLERFEQGLHNLPGRHVGSHPLLVA